MWAENQGNEEEGEKKKAKEETKSRRNCVSLSIRIHCKITSNQALNLKVPIQYT